MKKILLAVTGASGMPYAFSLAKALHETKELELHLLVSHNAKDVIEKESAETLEALLAYAHTNYDITDFASAPSSGSWLHDGMIICPCSMASLASISHGCQTNLIHRAADVCLKERRKLLIVVRETPFQLIHVQNMQNLILAGASIMPACPSFYNQPKTIDEMVTQFTGRILDQVGIENTLTKRWK